MSWIQDADCAKYPDEAADIWFPDDEVDDEETIAWKEEFATTVCAKCPVIEPCLELGMQKENLRWGIFGGLTAKQRRNRATDQG